MITEAAVDYCTRCKCKTLHVPMPNGDRVCEWHLGKLGLADPLPPAPPAAREREPA